MIMCNCIFKEQWIWYNIAALTDDPLFPLGADSVVYLSVEGLVSSVQESIKARQENNPKTHKSLMGKLGHCTACLTGDYPVELEW